MSQVEATEIAKIIDQGPRCVCGKLLAIALAKPWILDCPRCGVRNAG